MEDKKLYTYPYFLRLTQLASADPGILGIGTAQACFSFFFFIFYLFKRKKIMVIFSHPIFCNDLNLLKTDLHWLKSYLISAAWENSLVLMYLQLGKP